jgi:hypothetical protein
MPESCCWRFDKKENGFSEKNILVSFRVPTQFFIGHNESMTKHGLKGQYLLAQGQATGRSIALGSGNVTKIDRELT